jgi:hypothetical protein
MMRVISKCQLQVAVKRIPSKTAKNGISCLLGQNKINVLSRMTEWLTEGTEWINFEIGKHNKGGYKTAYVYVLWLCAQVILKNR